MKKVAIIGTQGIPAHYGGFETLAENLVRKKHNDLIEYTVFCSSKDLQTSDTQFLNARLKYINLHSNGVQSIIYDIVSMIRSIRGYDALLILGVSGCVFIPVLKMLTHSRVIVNIDGLEHRRQKWGRMAKWFLRLSEKMAVRFANIIIADNQGIEEYVQKTYNKHAVMIEYGGDHALMNISRDKELEILKEFGLVKGEYALSICRIEPENNVEMVLDVFARTKHEIAIVGNFQNNEYSRNLRGRYDGHPNIHIIDACYDLEKLYALRRNAGYYVHGHSAGGTNPSLVEAMHFGIPIITFDVNYNRFTTNNEAEYFENGEQLEALLKKQRMPSGAAMIKYANENYRWDTITQKYEKLFF